MAQGVAVPGAGDGQRHPVGRLLRVQNALHVLEGVVVCPGCTHAAGAGLIESIGNVELDGTHWFAEWRTDSLPALLTRAHRLTDLAQPHLWFWHNTHHGLLKVLDHPTNTELPPHTWPQLTPIPPTPSPTTTIPTR